jgi:hypothetical protein
VRTLAFFLLADLRAVLGLLVLFPVAAFFLSFSFGFDFVVPAAALGLALPVEDMLARLAGIMSLSISLALLAALPRVEPIALATSVSGFSVDLEFSSFAIDVSVRLVTAHNKL